MNRNIKTLIESVADNNLQRARQAALCIVTSDNTKSNKNFCMDMKYKLNKPTAEMVELPANIKGLITMKKVNDFPVNRYYLSEREQDFFDKIIKMHKASQELKEMSIHYVNAAIMYGESGVGKTMLGQYIAYSLDIPFAYINFSNLIGSLLGETGSRINRIFTYIKQVPCVFMLDELDAIGMSRNIGNDVNEMSRIVISLMQEMDNLSNDNIVLAATNRIDIIDAALKRRFSIKHEVKRFSVDEIRDMVSMFLNDVNIKIDDNILSEWCDRASKKDMSQADIMNEITQKIADSIISGNDLNLLLDTKNNYRFM